MRLEAIVLSGIMLHPDALKRIGEFLSLRHFESLAHRLIYDAARTEHARGVTVDVVVVARELRDNAKLAAAGGTRYLAQLTHLAPSALMTEAAALQLMLSSAELARTGGDP